MQCVVSLNTKIPKIGPAGIGTGTPALTAVQDLDCIPRVGEHLALLENGNTRSFVVVKVTYLGDAKGIAGCYVIVEEVPVV